MNILSVWWGFLKKKKTAFFVLGSAVIGTALVQVVLRTFFNLHGILNVVITILALAAILAVAAGGLVFWLVFSWATGKKQAGYIGADGATSRAATLGECSAAIKNYLREHQSTAFFREKLNAILKLLNAFGSRRDTIQDVIKERFGSGLSYSKFAAPVMALEEHLIDQVNNLVSRMRIFNEEEYRRKITEFTTKNRIEEAAEYKEIEQEYKDYTEQIITAFDSAALKLDKLTLEMSKLRESDVDKAMSIMNDLDSAIKETQLYK